MSVESDDYDGMEGMSPDNGGSENGANGVGNGLNKDGKPETEEEKRKNFLERNRQGERIVLLRSALAPVTVISRSGRDATLTLSFSLPIPVASPSASRSQVPTAKEGMAWSASGQGRVPPGRERRTPADHRSTSRRGLSTLRDGRRRSARRTCLHQRNRTASGSSSGAWSSGRGRKEGRTGVLDGRRRVSLLLCSVSVSLPARCIFSIAFPFPSPSTSPVSLLPL